MTIGSLVHELFQIVLSKKLKTIQEIQSVTNDMLNSREMMFTLYETQMTLEECQTELNKFTPKILQFIEHYITGDNMKVSRVSLKMQPCYRLFVFSLKRMRLRVKLMKFMILKKIYGCQN